MCLTLWNGLFLRFSFCFLSHLFWYSLSFNMGAFQNDCCVAFAPGKLHRYLLQKGTRTVAILFECLPVFHKKLDIQLILQLSGCLS